MYEIQLASFALGFVFGTVCLSAFTCIGIILLAWRFSTTKKEENVR